MSQTNVKNLANALLGAPLADTDTAAVLSAGYGATMPAVPFKLTLTPFGQLATQGNSEIIMVTAISGDNLTTIVRGVDGTTAKDFDTGAIVSNGVYTEDVTTPAGVLVPFAGISAPAGWLLAYGQAVNIADYPNLYAALRKALGNVTITIASPGVVTATAHGLRTGDKVYLATTGALPTGLTAGTAYYVHVIDANTFHLATTNANAYLASYINTSGSQSGTQSAAYVPWGDGDHSTTFNLPDARGMIFAGKDDMGGTAANVLNMAAAGGIRGYNLGNTGGEQAHAQTVSELAAHAHDHSYDNTNGWAVGAGKASTSGATSQVGGAWSDRACVATNGLVRSAGSGVAFNEVQPTAIANYIIKI